MLLGYRPSDRRIVVQFPAGARGLSLLYSVHTGSEAHSGSYQGQDVKLIAQLHLVPRLWMRRALPPLPHPSSRHGVYLTTGTTILLRFIFFNKDSSSRVLYHLGNLRRSTSLPNVKWRIVTLRIALSTFRPADWIRKIITIWGRARWFHLPADVGVTATAKHGIHLLRTIKVHEFEKKKQ
jgi:hypothetical protein